MPAKKQTTNQLPTSIHEGLRPLFVEIENFKNIDKMAVNIGGESILVIAKNGSGKSSFIQALMSPLNAKMLPSEPIKNGEDHARIQLKLGGVMHGQQEEYTLDMFFTPKDKTGRLVASNKNNEKIPASKTFIKDLIGNVSFDIMDWLRADKKKKLEIIKSLTGRGKEIDIINIAIKKIKDDRKYKVERAEQLEGSLKSHEFTQEEINQYSQQIDLGPLQQQFNAIAEKQKIWDGFKLKMDGVYRDINESNRAIEAASSEIMRLESLINEQKALIDSHRELLAKNMTNKGLGEHYFAITPRPDITPVQEEINHAIAHNEKFNRIGMLGNQQREMIQLKQEAEVLKSNITAMEEERSIVIQNSQLSIPGLSFTDEELYINGLPLEEGQQNTAHLFSIGVDVAIALNPNLRVIFLNDASLFDRPTLKAVVEKIEQAGYMAICEMVDPSGKEDMHIEFAERAL